MMKIWNKNTGPDFKQNYKPGLAFYWKNPGPLCPWIFVFKVNNMKYWHPHLPFGQHISVSTLVNK
jgi:hypothetical protein